MEYKFQMYFRLGWSIFIFVSIIGELMKIISNAKKWDTPWTNKTNCTLIFKEKNKTLKLN